jgi:hypothetical protein
MKKRIQLQKVLSDFASENGGFKVYYQPPSNLKLELPCIVYEDSNFNSKFADNRAYFNCTEYQITYITSDADSDIPEKLMEILPCRITSKTKTDGMYNYIMYLNNI